MVPFGASGILRLMAGVCFWTCRTVKFTGWIKLVYLLQLRFEVPTPSTSQVDFQSAFRCWLFLLGSLGIIPSRLSFKSDQSLLVILKKGRARTGDSCSVCNLGEWCYVLSPGLGDAGMLWFEWHMLGNWALRGIQLQVSCLHTSYRWRSASRRLEVTQHLARATATSWY